MSDECRVNKFCSAVCDRGTQCCDVEHKSEPDPQDGRALQACPFCGADKWEKHFAVSNSWILEHESGCFFPGVTIFYLPGDLNAKKWNLRAAAVEP